MSIKAVEYFLHVCDCCGVEAEYGDFSAWSSIDTAGMCFPDDWAQVGDDDLCDDCWTWPDDETADRTGSDDPIRAHAEHPRAMEATA